MTPDRDRVRRVREFGEEKQEWGRRTRRKRKVPVDYVAHVPRESSCLSVPAFRPAEIDHSRMSVSLGNLRDKELPALSHLLGAITRLGDHWQSSLIERDHPVRGGIRRATSSGKSLPLREARVPLPLDIDRSK